MWQLILGLWRRRAALGRRMRALERNGLRPTWRAAKPREINKRI